MTTTTTNCTTSHRASITMLGTGNAMCTNCYNTCFVLQSPAGARLMVDAGGGNGVMTQLQRAHIAFEDIHHLFITHSHPDHIMGAVWMIRKISPMQNHGRYKGTFHIYCHSEVAKALRTICSLTIPPKILRALEEGTICFHELTDGEQVQIGDMQVTFFDIGSTKLLQYGFSAQVPTVGRVVCLGDEPYHDSSHRWVEGCDWLLCEAFCLYDDRAQFRPYEKHHSTALDAGLTAQGLGVKNLLLYHTEDQHLNTRRKAYTAEAQRTFAGRVEVPDDLETVLL